MKSKIFLKLALMFTATFFMMQSCSKDDEIAQEAKETEVTEINVRPDFSTLDTRPPEVIAQHQVTGENTQPVKLSKLKARGKYALVIGISDYQGSSSDLQYCDDDANDWSQRLRTEGYNVTVIKDAQATKARIQNAVNRLASLSVNGNEIAFCYSGHGSNGSIVTSDLYYINSQWFKTKFANAQSRKMMFCFDACTIGAMKQLKAQGRVVVVASNATLLSYDGDSRMRNGVFTYYMMKGFDQVGYKFLEPDCQYAIRNMKDWASRNNIQVAPSFVDNYAGNFDL